MRDLILRAEGAYVVHCSGFIRLPRRLCRSLRDSTRLALDEVKSRRRSWWFLQRREPTFTLRLRVSRIRDCLPAALLGRHRCRLSVGDHGGLRRLVSIDVHC